MGAKKTVGVFALRALQHRFWGKHQICAVNFSSASGLCAHPSPWICLPARGFADYPPHTIMNMPSLSPTMEQGNLVSWKIKEGDAIAPGDLLADVETDKATLGFENQEEGYIAKILVAEGTQEIKVGSPLAVVVEDEELVASFKDFQLSSQATTTTTPPQTQQTQQVDVKISAVSVEVSSKIGPAARMLLQDAGLSASDVTPSGPNNIVTKGDVLKAIESGVKPTKPDKKQAAQVTPTPTPAPASTPSPTPAPGTPPPLPLGDEENYLDIPNSQIRKIIAERLLHSKQNLPAIYVTADAPLDAVMELRAALKAQSGIKVSVNDVVVLATAKALEQVPGINASWNVNQEEIEIRKDVDVCIAVATDNGLITPIVKNANQKSLQQLSAEIKDLAVRARDNKLKPEEFQGGSFTISNLGMFGMTHFTAIINPPQAGILAIGGGQKQIELVNGKPTAHTVMNVTLSADNRVIDHEMAGQFMDAFSELMKNPVTMLMQQ